jgi:hypothetical protein
VGRVSVEHLSHHLPLAYPLLCAVFSRYLEIGCDNEENFEKMQGFSVALCVDPRRGGTHRMTSDEFFATNTQVDGLADSHSKAEGLVKPFLPLLPRPSPSSLSTGCTRRGRC